MIRFQTALDKLQESKLSESSQELLYTCIQNQLLPNEVAQFQSTLQLYFTNKEVCEYNYSQLIAMNRSIKKILSKYTGQNASKVTDKEVDNLLTELLVCISTQVILSMNLQTENRLMNGSIGIVEDILQDIDQDLSINILSLLLIYFSEYSGLDFPSYRSKIILIFPVTCQFKFKGIPCTCTQFPLYLVYIITVYKSQGLILSQVILNLDQREYCLGLLYIVVLQVKILDRLIFEQSFNFDYFRSIDSITTQDRDIDFNYRKNQLL